MGEFRSIPLSFNKTKPITMLNWYTIQICQPFSMNVPKIKQTTEMVHRRKDTLAIVIVALNFV